MLASEVGSPESSGLAGGAFADYCAKADWPEGWAARDVLPHRANFGLLLRWKAALFELERFVGVPEKKVIAVLSAFAEAVGRAAQIRQRL